jgi:hypothetical protein
MKGPVEGEAFQFLQPQWKPTNTFSTGTHGKHCIQLTKYQELDAIGHWTTPGQNLVGPHIAWS